MLEPSNGGASPGADIVRFDAATGAHQVLVPAAKLVPPGALRHSISRITSGPRTAHACSLFTNSRRVWRQNTRGDYWMYDLKTGALRQLGAGSPPSTLMFATFSPDGQPRRICEASTISTSKTSHLGRITPLTSDGSTTIINGTFDWVYEEELNLRDGFRWSPDGRQIAYWQLDASGVRDYDLIDDTDSLYSFVKPVQYPEGRDDEFRRPRRRRQRGGRTDSLVQRPRRPAQQLHRADGMGSQLDGDRPAAPESAPGHARPS